MGNTPFKPGNQLWKERVKHGRPRLIETPEELWDKAVGYFQWCDENPFLRKDYKGQMADTVYYEHPRAYTLAELWFYLGISKDTWYNYKEVKGYLEVINEIEGVIYTQKFQGAAAGFFKENIIARDLGLIERKDVTSGGDKLESGVVIFEIPDNGRDKASEDAKQD